MHAWSWCAMRSVRPYPRVAAFRSPARRRRRRTGWSSWSPSTIQDAPRRRCAIGIGAHKMSLMIEDYRGHRPPRAVARQWAVRNHHCHAEWHPWVGQLPGRAWAVESARSPRPAVRWTNRSRRSAARRRVVDHDSSHHRLTIPFRDPSFTVRATGSQGSFLMLSLRTAVTVLHQDIGDTTGGLGGDTSSRAGPAQGHGGVTARLLRCRKMSLSMPVSVSLSRCGQPMRRVER